MSVINPDQLMTALNWRYATKAFDPSKKIAPDLWEKLEDTLVLSPSSFGLQPYKFLVINDAAKREELMGYAWGQRQVVDASHFVVFAGRTSATEDEINEFLELTASARNDPKASLDGYAGMIRGFLLNDDFKAFAPHWTARQAYIALGNLLTSAALLGVDACPMEGLDPAKFTEALGLADEGYAALVGCALGYRSADDKYASLPKVRFDKSKLVQHV
jgi:nitroreductase